VDFCAQHAVESRSAMKKPRRRITGSFL